MFSSAVKSIWKKAFSKHLLLTNVGISITLSGAGDFLTQHHNLAYGNQKNYDKLRTRNLAATGATIGVLCHHWYKILDKRLPGRTLKVVAKKLLVDQVMFSPICLSVFFISLSIFKGCDFSEFLFDLKERGLTLYTAEWVVWTPAQVINFFWLPTKYRVLYDNSVSLILDVYTSHVCFDKDFTDSSTNSNKSSENLITLDR